MRVSNPSNLTTHFGPNSFIGVLFLYNFVILVGQVGHKNTCCGLRFSLVLICLWVSFYQLGNRIDSILSLTVRSMLVIIVSTVRSMVHELVTRAGKRRRVVGSLRRQAAASRR